MSLLDGYNSQEENKNSLLNGYVPETDTKRKSLLDGYNPDKEQIEPQTETTEDVQPIEEQPTVLTGGVSKDEYINTINNMPLEIYTGKKKGQDWTTLNNQVLNDKSLSLEDKKQLFEKIKASRDLMADYSSDGNFYNALEDFANAPTYDERFPERSKNLLGNAWSDTKDLVSGLAQLVGNSVNFGLLRPTTDLLNGEGLFTGKGREDLKNLFNSLPALGEGLKENYGQKDFDMVNWERVKNGEFPVQVDLAGLGQSFYSHPLNILDLVGLGEVGKIGKVKNLTKGGQVSKFSKTVGNKTLSPKYSENLVYNAGQRLLETEPVQNIINAIDNSKLRPTTDVVADFLGLSPDSRLMGTKGAEVRQAKLIEQANQTKNIAERNKAIAENQKLLSGLSEEEAKGLIDSIESGSTEFSSNIPTLKELKSNISKSKFPNYKLQTIKHSKQGHYYTQSLDNLENDVIRGTREFNDIIKDLYKNPEKATDLNYITEMENKIQSLIPGEEYLPGAQKEAFDKFYGAIDNANSYNNLKAGNTSYFIDTAQKKPLTEKMKEIRGVLKTKVEANADAYKSMGKLSDETIEQLPINTYAAIKNQKKIIDLTDAEKLDALNDIQKMPAEQRPFYVPRMFDDKLRASDFFANSTKRYKPNELKQRKVGFGDEDKTGGKRIYDPVELANRLDAHRIKMINTENMINEIVENFAKPLDLSKEKVLDGYVPFNPDAFFKFYRGAIDLNETTLRKLQELDNIDTALKTSLQEAIKQLPDDVINYMGAIKNNKIYQIPEDVAKTLTQGKNTKGVWEMMFDMGTAGFKRKVLGTNPKWFINNRIGNGIMAGLKGVMPQDYIRALKVSEDLLPDALKTKSMYEAEKTIIGRTGGGNNTAFGNTMRLLGGEFIDTKDLKGLDKLKVQAANTLGIPGNIINKVTDAMFKFNQVFEDWERRAAYINKSNTVGRKMIKTTGQNIAKQDELLKAVIDNPEVLNEVMKQVDNTLGDYINMTSFERRNLRKLVPFYSWYRTITRYTLSLPESNPFRANIASKLSMINADKDESVPEYQRGRVETGLTSDLTGKPLVLNYQHSIPFSTFGETADNPTGSLTPYINSLYETSTGRRTFLNKPFVSPNYENVFPNGYASLDSNNLGEFVQELPTGEKFKALPIDLARKSIPLMEEFEKYGIGGIDNLIKNGDFRPYDALYDTSLGGYNYDEGFSKRPKGWTLKEELLRKFLPLQEEKQEVKKKVKIKRKPKN